MKVAFYTLGCKVNQYETQALEQMLRERDENFGNARDVRNLFEQALSRQADRVAQLEAPTREQLMALELDDVKQNL